VPIISFVDEGIERVLDTFQERAGINAIFGGAGEAIRQLGAG
jgi:hypothetical protein